MIDITRFKAITFDCYGTLIDWETGIADTVRPWLPDPAMPIDLVISAFALMQARHQQVRPALLYPEVLRRTWRDVEGTFGWPHDEARGRAFAASAGDWPPFPDTVASLRHLRRFFRLAILSNVDNASLARTLRLLEVPFDLTVTAEDVGAYKPDAPHFERAFAALAGMGIARGDILHVAQSKHHDVVPGRRHGLTTVWVNRRHGRPGSGATLATEAEPDLTVTSLAELVALHTERCAAAGR
ncbi:MAG: HAD-IA family hydrolase [Alphaproteobacteria bacterium]|nr:HAD-IA family hydrolase [Alphaproteobacteria bacterium]